MEDGRWGHICDPGTVPEAQFSELIVTFPAGNKVTARNTLHVSELALSRYPSESQHGRLSLSNTQTRPTPGSRNITNFPGPTTRETQGPCLRRRRQSKGFSAEPLAAQDPATGKDHSLSGKQLWGSEG